MMLACYGVMFAELPQPRSCLVLHSPRTPKCELQEDDSKMLTRTAALALPVVVKASASNERTNNTLVDGTLLPEVMNVKSRVFLHVRQAKGGEYAGGCVVVCSCCGYVC